MPLNNFVFQAALIALISSSDSFIIGFSYGLNKVKIPLISLLTVSFVSSLALTLAALFGALVGQSISLSITKGACATILLVFALIKLFDAQIKRLINRFKNKSVVLDIYASPENADSDKSKSISPYEACALAAALSLDGAAVGFGSGLMTDELTFFLWLFCLAFLLSMTLTSLGLFLGKKVKFSCSDLASILSGALLILLAIMVIIS